MGKEDTDAAYNEKVKRPECSPLQAHHLQDPRSPPTGPRCSHPFPRVGEAVSPFAEQLAGH
eukprot:7823105-Pyramimonas_sp.AAC.1